MVTVVLGLGANLGIRERQLQNAVDALRPWLDNLACSPVYESPALLPPKVQPEWNIPFLNMAVRGETSFSPLMLLAKIKNIEQKLGRVKLAHWGPREIDIDILAYGNDTVKANELTIPHAHLLARDFALVPLADVAPGWIHPDAGGKTAVQLASGRAKSLMKTDWVIA